MNLAANAFYELAYAYLAMAGIAFEGTVRAWSYFGVVNVSLTEVTPSIPAETIPTVLPRLWQEVRIMFPEASQADMAQGTLQKGAKIAVSADDGRTLRVASVDQIRHGGGVGLIHGLSELADHSGIFTIVVRPAARAENPASAACKELRFEAQGCFRGATLQIDRVAGALSLESLAELQRVVDSVAELKRGAHGVPIKRTYARAIGEEIVSSALSSADAEVSMAEDNGPNVECTIVSSASDFATHEVYVRFGCPLFKRILGPAMPEPECE